MTTEELAREAFAALNERAPAFDALDKNVRLNLLDIAEKGGDTTPFGKQVKRILRGELAVETDVAFYDSFDVSNSLSAKDIGYGSNAEAESDSEPVVIVTPSETELNPVTVGGGNVELHDTEKELKKQTWENLRDHARKLGAEVPDEWDKDHPKSFLIQTILDRQKPAK